MTCAGRTSRTPGFRIASSGTKPSPRNILGMTSPGWHPGHSTGGQNAMGALLFHPEFYKVAVASSGCHDNRMDKIWWNEQWMGWPIGPLVRGCFEHGERIPAIRETAADYRRIGR